MARESKKPAVKPGKPTKVKKQRKSPKTYFREVISEIKKVSWPTRKEFASYLSLVLVFVCFMAVVLGVMDAGLSYLMKLLVA